MKFLTKWRKKLLKTALLITVLIFTWKAYWRHEDIRVALEYGHLAELPENSFNIQVETAGGMFSRTFWLSFESTDAEINAWLNQSKESGLERREWYDTTRNREDYIVVRLDNKTKQWEKFSLEPSIPGNPPAWFKPENVLQLEYYGNDTPEKALVGHIWIDRKNRRVFIKTSYS